MKKAAQPKVLMLKKISIKILTANDLRQISGGKIIYVYNTSSGNSGSCFTI